MADEFVPSAPSPLTSFTATTDANTTGFSGSWYHPTAWTVNVTHYAPILGDIAWAGPRFVKKLGSYISVSDHLETTSNPPDYLTAVAGASAILAEANPTIQNIMEPLVGTGGPELTSADVATTSGGRVSVDSARSLGSVFGYATSKWALCCIAMAVILNRTHIFAATRRRLRLRWPTRLLLRFVPIVLLLLQARQLLQSIQCQTSLDFSELRWGNTSKSSDLMFAHGNSFLNSLSSALLLSASDEQSCIAVKMIPSDESGSARDLKGSLSLLWPLFGTFCLSQFIETVSCAVQGRPVAPETGMTLFEQSLAFAEADAAISNQLGWNLFTKTASTSVPSSGLGNAIALTRSMVMKRVNTSPEVLLVAFLSLMTHITSHVLGVFNLQAKYRLISTGFWGLCFMASIVWAAISFDLDDPSSQSLLRFPTVCIIGFVPHVLVLLGIGICLFIYGLAILLSAISPPSTSDVAPLSFRQRIAHAHDNMQANVSLSSIRITREMDFYTALLRTGFGAITMASEAVYLNEDKGVSLKRRTWLEEERFKEVEELQRKLIGGGLPDSRYDQVGAIGLIPVKGGPTIASNGYARERAAQKIPKGRGERNLRAGIGAAERSSRWLMALEFLLSINKLVARICAKSLLWSFATLRIRYRPSWLLRLAQHPKSISADGKGSSLSQVRPRGVSSYNDGRIPKEETADIEAEFRRRGGGQDEESFDSEMYRYWVKNGWWGSTDTSGDFEPHSDDDFDATSVISLSTAGDAVDDYQAWESDDENDDGQRTPTQRSPHMTRESTPFQDTPMQISDLARLLHPTNPEEREEAITLSAHLQSDGIMTRAKYRRMEQLQRTRVLTTPGSGLLQPRTDTLQLGRKSKLDPDEEERLLEQLLLSRRQASATAASVETSWEEGGSGFGSDGPQCVVCQSSPRTIIVWPCRCLSLCDDCRVSLAMNNFDKCVCCRREVISFSRVFVP
ncbi:integral membrane protein [Fusarium heterosporum]|uniref:Integral membrane protein n=1 Tax=Fusarium heterosporum TaxID=42747 RepID=A0A8H5T2V8_FUSHE|nr:integral membrane protein [Fusarium heterosporum]